MWLEPLHCPPLSPPQSLPCPQVQLVICSPWQILNLSSQPQQPAWPGAQRDQRPASHRAGAGRTPSWPEGSSVSRRYEALVLPHQARSRDCVDASPARPRHVFPSLHPWHEAASTQVAGSLSGSLKATPMWYPARGRRELPGETPEVSALVRLLWSCGPRGEGVGGGGEVAGES